MRPVRMLAILLRHFYLLRGSPARIVPLFAWTAVDMTLWGFFTRYLDTLAAPGFHLVPAVLGAVLLWNFFIRVMNSVTGVFFEDVWSRNFLNMFAAPISIGDYLGGLVLSSIGTSLIGLLVMLFLVTAVFGLAFFSFGLVLIPFVLELFLFGVSMGILGCSIVLRFGPAAEWFVWPIPSILAPFATVFYPLSTLPVWMRPVSRMLPPSYVFETLRAIVAGRQPPASGILTGAVLVSAYLVLACLVFTGIYRRAVRTGLIARYSAETVS